jgi:hypothetical protein
MLMRRTKASGPMAVRGVIEERMGIDWRMALARKTTLERRRNWSKRHFGMKVRAVYLAV